MHVVWIRKVRKYGEERAIQIPKEIARNLSDFVILTLENGKLVILTLEEAEKLGIFKKDDLTSQVSGGGEE